jgi:cytoskeletal protein CcmA (bactofilin family)
MADPAHQDVGTILGPDSHFKGEVTFETALRVCGRFEGKITTAGRLHVAKEAAVEAEVEAGTIVVEGQVQGPLAAGQRLELKQSARCQGDLRASRMVVEEGAVFCGHVSVGPDALKGQEPADGALTAASMAAALSR